MNDRAYLKNIPPQNTRDRDHHASAANSYRILAPRAAIPTRVIVEKSQGPIKTYHSKHERRIEKPRNPLPQQANDRIPKDKLNIRIPQQKPSTTNQVLPNEKFNQIRAPQPQQKPMAPNPTKKKATPTPQDAGKDPRQQINESTIAKV